MESYFVSGGLEFYILCNFHVPEVVTEMNFFYGWAISNYSSILYFIIILYNYAILIDKDKLIDTIN